MTSIPSGRPHKILEALFHLSPDGPCLVTYEDIVVKVWELYPDEFGLRGYSDRFPDASDIHVPLYKELKSHGLVTTGPARQKKFRLTEAGWDLAQSLFSDDAAIEEGAGAGRPSRTTIEEIRHLDRTTAVQLYTEGARDDILDTDFYAFYRTSVRAAPREFEGRLVQTRRAIDEAGQKGVGNAALLGEIDDFLRSRFEDIIAVKSQNETGGG